MLRKIIFVSSSGMLLYQKEFKASHAPLPGDILGAIIVATLDFSVQRTGASVAYIELDKVGIAVSQEASCRCITVVDQQDGPLFARLVAIEMLTAFHTRFMKLFDSGVLSLNKFTPFTNEINDVMKLCIRAVLDHLAAQPGVSLALITGSAGNSHLFYSTKDIDKIGVLASLPRMVEKSTDVFINEDEYASMKLANRNSTVHIHRIERAQFLCIVKNDPVLQGNSLEVMDTILGLLRRILETCSLTAS